MAEQPLFDERTRRKLEQLTLFANKVRSGAIKGERRSSKRGTSIEFADYRNYVQGDDLRRLDWNLYARTNRPYIKLFEDEEDLAVHLILDTSESMNFPQDSENSEHNKFTYSQRLLAGLATISLITNDRLVMIAANGSDVIQFGPSRGRVYTSRMFQYVSGLKTGGKLEFNTVLQDYVRRETRSGLAVLITDMFHSDGYMDGIGALVGRGFEVAILHVLSPEELEPPLAGDLELIDAETGTAQDVTVDAGMRQLYIKRLTEWQTHIGQDLRKRGVHYLPVRTDISFERVIMTDLRQLGVVR